MGWYIFGESRWHIPGENYRYILAENWWHIPGENRRYIIVRKMTGTTDDAVWLNDGGLQGETQGSFTQQPGLAVQKTKAVKLGDLDGDGDLDVVLCASDTYNVIWFNVAQQVYLPLVLRNYP